MLRLWAFGAYGPRRWGEASQASKASELLPSCPIGGSGGPGDYSPSVGPATKCTSSTPGSPPKPGFRTEPLERSSARPWPALRRLLEHNSTLHARCLRGLRMFGPPSRQPKPHAHFLHLPLMAHAFKHAAESRRNFQSPEPFRRQRQGAARGAARSGGKPLTARRRPRNTTQRGAEAWASIPPGRDIGSARPSPKPCLSSLHEQSLRNPLEPCCTRNRLWHLLGAVTPKLPETLSEVSDLDHSDVCRARRTRQQPRPQPQVQARIARSAIESLLSSPADSRRGGC